MFKRFLLLLTLAVPAFCQTPCIDDARTGKVGSCLNQTVPVTRADAQFVTAVTIPGYVVAPDVPYLLSLQFATQEQALAIVELIKFNYPGSTLTLVDNGVSSNSYPPYKVLKYFNAGGLYDPRIYTASGTIVVDGVAYQTNFIFGWFINVSKLIFLPGSTGLTAVAELGGAYPHWK